MGNAVIDQHAVKAALKMLGDLEIGATGIRFGITPCKLLQHRRGDVDGQIAAR
ncbi:hypothetical protein D3C74_451120 [compost metagenome]